VSGFLPNVAAVDSQLVVHSQKLLSNPVNTQSVAAQFTPLLSHVPVDTTLKVAADGYFEGFVPIDPSVPLNPIVVEATRSSTQAKFGTSLQRSVTVVGPSVASGVLTPLSLGARAESWLLQKFANYDVAQINTPQGIQALNQSVQGEPCHYQLGLVPVACNNAVSISGPLGITVRPTTEYLAVDLFIPHIFADHQDADPDYCEFFLNMDNVTAHLQLNIQPTYDPTKVSVTDVSGSPTVEIGNFSASDPTGNPACDLGALILGAKGAAKKSLAGALAAGTTGGPVGGPIANALNSVNLSGILSSLNVNFSTRFHDVTEDLLGVALDLDTGIVPSCMPTSISPIQSCGSPPIKAAAAVLPTSSPAYRIYQTTAAHPPFPLLSPSGATYDLALALAPDALNQLLAALTANGYLAGLLSQEAIPEPGLALFGLQATPSLTPTLAPILTGQPGTSPGSTQVELGQLILQVPTMAGDDFLREAIDLKADLLIDLVQAPVPPPPASATLCTPAPPGSSEPVCVIRLQITNLTALALQTLHVPSSFSPQLASAIPGVLASVVPSALSTTAIVTTYPLPSFTGFELQPLGLTLEPNGGALVFANLQLGP
jgi:hypothetical protein